MSSHTRRSTERAFGPGGPADTTDVVSDDAMVCREVDELLVPHSTVQRATSAHENNDRAGPGCFIEQARAIHVERRDRPLSGVLTGRDQQPSIIVTAVEIATVHAQANVAWAWGIGGTRSDYSRVVAKGRS
jgi:hypothetical protein